MHPVWKTSVGTTLCALAALSAVWMLASPALPAEVTSGAMSVANQNALVQKYCAICHTDASRNGGLSLEHFDAAHLDPGIAAMMYAKLKTGAIGAAGLPRPDQATQDEWISTTLTEAAGAGSWTVNRSQKPRTGAQIVTASVVEEVLSTAKDAVVPDLYRLALSCDFDTRELEMQLAWSPGVPQSGQTMMAAADGNAPVTYKIEGKEKMGNGTDVTSGPGAVMLRAADLPARTLTISNLFPDETVVFAFDALPKTTRQALSTCFSGSSARQ